MPRPLEVALASLALVVLSPLLVLIALLVAVGSRGPVLFRHERQGLNGCRFSLFKFRTMRPSQDGPEFTAADDARITVVGRLLRRTKLDELPQLWNVVRGDMSLVGPRPEAPRYVDLKDPRWQDVLSVRPGLADPATLRSGDEETRLAAVAVDRERYYREVLVPVKLEGSIAYLRERTWESDLRVLLRTLGCLVGFPPSRP